MDYNEAIKYLEIIASMRQELNPEFWCIDDLSNEYWDNIYRTFAELYSNKIPARMKLRNNTILEIDRVKKQMIVYDNGVKITDYNKFRNIGITLDLIARATLKTLQEVYYAKYK